MKLRELFAKVLREKPIHITDDLARRTTRKWDSLRHIELVAAVEKAYGIKISNAEVMSIQSFLEMKQLIIERGLEP